jgi:glutaredoxin
MKYAVIYNKRGCFYCINTKTQLHLFTSYQIISIIDLPQIRKIIKQDIDKGESFRNTTVNAVDTEYYILFRDKKLEILQKRIHTLISNLAACSLNSRQVSDDDLRVIIDSFFNGNIKSEFGTVMSSV